GEGEGGDDLRQRDPAAAAQEEPEEEEQVVVAAQDVLDTEQKEAHRPAAAGAADGHARLARLGREGELPAETRGLDPGERVVVGTEDVEEIVSDQEVADWVGAGEVHDEGDALPLRRRWAEESRAGLAAPLLGDNRDLRLEEPEESALARGAAGAGPPELLGDRGPHGRGPERQARPDAPVAERGRGGA